MAPSETHVRVCVCMLCCCMCACVGCIRNEKKRRRKNGKAKNPTMIEQEIDYNAYQSRTCSPIPTLGVEVGHPMGIIDVEIRIASRKVCLTRLLFSFSVASYM
jgi:hypothetical protein